MPNIIDTVLHILTTSIEKYGNQFYVYSILARPSTFNLFLIII